MYLKSEKRGFIINSESISSIHIAKSYPHCVFVYTFDGLRYTLFNTGSIKRARRFLSLLSKEIGSEENTMIDIDEVVLMTRHEE